MYTINVYHYVLPQYIKINNKEPQLKGGIKQDQRELKMEPTTYGLIVKDLQKQKMVCDIQTLNASTSLGLLKAFVCEIDHE